MYKKYSMWHRVLILLCIIALISNFSIYTYAYPTKIDMQREASLTVLFQTKDDFCSGADFRLYHIANMTDTATFILTEAFQDTAISLQSLNEVQWKTLAQDLTEYISKARLMPLTEQKTDAQGRAIFTGLVAGLYLVVGESYHTEKGIYTPVPFLVRLPEKNTEKEWGYEMEAVVKYTMELASKPPELPKTGENRIFIPLFLMGGSIFVILKLHSGRKNVKKQKMSL